MTKRLHLDSKLILFSNISKCIKVNTTQKGILYYSLWQFHNYIAWELNFI